MKYGNNFLLPVSGQDSVLFTCVTVIDKRITESRMSTSESYTLSLHLLLLSILYQHDLDMLTAALVRLLQV